MTRSSIVRWTRPLLSSAIALTMLLPGLAARAELVEFELAGRVTSVAANGDPSVLEQWDHLGVVPSARFEASVVVDTETPADDSGNHPGAVRWVRMRVGDYTLRGPVANQSDRGTVWVRTGEGLIFGLQRVVMEDSPDILLTNPSEIFEFLISGPSFFDSDDVPSELPDPADGTHTASGRFFGGDEIARRFGIAFEIDSIRRADDSPQRLGEVLLGLKLRPHWIVFHVESTGCTGKEDFEVLVRDGEVVELELVRVTPDPCRVAPFAQRIVFRHAELGLSPGDLYRVVNPTEASGRRALRTGQAQGGR